MSHYQQMSYIYNLKLKFPNQFTNKKVLEIGSLNINGTVRVFFDECDYIGIDVGAGNCVDIVCEGQNYDAPDNTFDTTISCECFEHNPYWVETFKNMHRMTKPGGLVIMTCATDGRPEHGTPRTTPNDSPLTIGVGWEYYKNLNANHFETEFNLKEMFAQHAFSVDLYCHDLYFYGFKL